MIKNILKAACLSSLIFLFSCGNKDSRFLKKLPSGEIEVEFSQINPATYVRKEKIIEWGMEKPGGWDYELDERVIGAWVIEGKSYAVLSNRENSPMMRPSDNIEECFVAPLKEKEGWTFYGFIDDDFKKFLEKDLENYRKRVPEKVFKDYKKEWGGEGFKSIGNKIYLKKWVKESCSIGVVRDIGNDPYIWVKENLGEFWQR
jgi:hypothetical protein